MNFMANLLIVQFAQRQMVHGMGPDLETQCMGLQNLAVTHQKTEIIRITALPPGSLEASVAQYKDHSPHLFFVKDRECACISILISVIKRDDDRFSG